MRPLRLLPLLFGSTLSLLACGATSDPPEQGGGQGGAASGSAGTAGSNAGSDAAGASVSGGAGGAVAGTGGATAGSNPVGGAGGAVGRGAIASGQLGSCAIGLKGQVVCWGVYPNMPGMFEPPAGAFTRLVAGDFMCAQNQTGELSCFNEPASGVPIDHAPKTAVADFDIGLSAMCWLDQQGTASCARLDQAPPTDVEFSRIAVGDVFACGIRSNDGGITCWGDDGKDSPTCGMAPPTGQLQPPQGTFTQISAGWSYSACALRTDGTVACWGAGDATDDPNATFCDRKINFGQSQPPADHFTQISVGESHACGVKTDGTVACWGAGKTKADCSQGDDFCGQSLPPAGTFVEVAAGRTHTCGMHADRKVECWGSNTGGRSTPPADFP